MYIYINTYLYIYSIYFCTICKNKFNQPSQTNFQSIVYIYRNINKYIQIINKNRNIEIYIYQEK